jgi:hypothetical protein
MRCPYARRRHSLYDATRDSAVFLAMCGAMEALRPVGQRRRQQLIVLIMNLALMVKWRGAMDARNADIPRCPPQPPYLPSPSCSHATASAFLCDCSSACVLAPETTIRIPCNLILPSAVLTYATPSALFAGFLIAISSRMPAGIGASVRLRYRVCGTASAHADCCSACC